LSVIVPLVFEHHASVLTAKSLVGLIVSITLVLLVICGMLDQTWRVCGWLVGLDERVATVRRLIRGARAAYSAFVTTIANSEASQASETSSLTTDHHLMNSKSQTRGDLEAYLSSDMLGIMIKNSGARSVVDIALYSHPPLYDAEMKDLSSSPTYVDRLAGGEAVELRLHPKSVRIAIAAAMLYGSDYVEYKIGLRYSDALTSDAYESSCTIRIPPHNLRAIRHIKREATQPDPLERPLLRSTHEWLDSQSKSESA
jgi:hypothetical protein